MPHLNEIIDSLRNNSTSVLHINDEKLDKKSAEKLAQAIFANHTLKIVKLENLKFEKTGLASSFKLGNIETELKNKILSILLEVLSRHPTLEELYLQNLQFDRNDANTLAQKLLFFPKLQLVNLADNQIDDEGATLLVNALMTDQKIVELSLYKNGIGDVTAIALGKLLASNKTLCKLNLSENKITDKGAQHLAKALENNYALQKLYLGTNLLSDVSGQFFVTALSQNNHSGILALDIYNNKLSSACEKKIADAVEHNRSSKKFLRTEKQPASIGEFELLTEITRDEEQALIEQEGVEIKYTEERSSKDGYKKKLLIAQGSFGKVRLARYGQWFIGVKKIKGDKIRTSAAEIRLHTKLSGKPNIMPLFNAVESKDSRKQDTLYLFMPFAGFGNGRDFQRCIALLANPSLKEKFLLHIAKGLLTGIHSMHTSSIYHLDFKPDNFVITIRGEVFVIDFGHAKELNEGKLGKSGGDIRYYSPERFAQVRARKLSGSQNTNIPEIDAAKVDAWAIGVALLELAIGHYPFDNVDRDQRIEQWDTAYFAEKLAQIPQLQGIATDPIWDLIKGLLTLDPKQRLGVTEALAMPLLQQTMPQFASAAEQHQLFVTLKRLDPELKSAEKKEGGQYENSSSTAPEAISGKYYGGDEGQASPATNTAIPNDNNSSYRDTAPQRFFRSALQLSTNSNLQTLLTQLSNAQCQLQINYESQQCKIVFHWQATDENGIATLQKQLLDLQEILLLTLGMRTIQSFSREQNSFTMIWSSPEESEKALKVLQTLNLSTEKSELKHEQHS